MHVRMFNRNSRSNDSYNELYSSVKSERCNQPIKIGEYGGCLCFALVYGSHIHRAR